MARLRDMLGRPIQARFRSAIPNERGDRSLLGLISKVSSRPGLAERLYGEGEVFLVKGALFLTGVRLDESAYEGVGTAWKEDLGLAHYNPNAPARRQRLLPHALWLPHGFYAQIYLDESSPFLLRRERGTLYLYLGEVRLFPVEYERRPAYYDRATSTEAPMPHIGQHRLQRQVLVEYNHYCAYFSSRTECLFCGIISERPLHHSRYRKHFTATPQEVAEVVEAAYQEPSVAEFQVTGGVLPDRAEVDYFLEVGQAVRERLGVETIPGSQAVLVPPTLDRIEALKDSGWEGVAFNLEVWNPRLWPGLAPGKEATLSRDGWLEALEHAVQVFGKGNVASVLIAGLEPKRSHWEGVEWLAQRGIYGVPVPWTPVPGSALEGHQAPTAAWHLEVVARDLDIWERHGLPSRRHSSGGLHYEDLARMRERLRQEEAAQPGADLTSDLRHALAVEGRLPEL